jgi:hypothetical protein
MWVCGLALLAAVVMVALLLKPGDAAGPDRRAGQARAVTTARSAR